GVAVPVPLPVPVPVGRDTNRARARAGARARTETPARSMHERLTHFREILRYVPRFRDRVFVIAVDGAVVEDDNFPNLLLDIALLRSLSIRVALVHGAAHQVRRYAELFRLTPSDHDGTGITDRPDRKSVV